LNVGRFPAFLVLSCFICLSCSARAEEPFFKKDDVIALVGGEDMVAASEYGYLELLLTRALPELHLKFRCLAWEGDTVFEQRRDLNYPTLEQQLDQIGATVIIAQFGQMESLAGKEKLPEFAAAYEKLVRRLGAPSRRRFVLIGPSAPLQIKRDQSGDEVYSYDARIEVATERGEQLASRIGALSLPIMKAILASQTVVCLIDKPTAEQTAAFQRMELAWRSSLHTASHHLSEISHRLLAEQHAATLRRSALLFVNDERDSVLLRLIGAKNRLWFNYYRPQNWAFLAGDRTNQPSSRDHLDPTKRWFPAELEQFLPLIEAKEKQIWELAEKLAKP
jgi:hypothetical protein